jgi:hypothetical protein
MSEGYQFDIEREREIGEQLGFVVKVSNVNFPTLIWLDHNGALSRHSRGATEAEVRMWMLLNGQPYEPWSHSVPSVTRNALERLGVGRPRDVSPRDEGGA